MSPAQSYPVTCRSQHASFFDPTYYHRDSDVLSCGNLRSDHDHNGDCEKCQACKVGLCPTDQQDKYSKVDGCWYHTVCARKEYLRDTVEAIMRVLDEAAKLSGIDEEALHMPGDEADMDHAVQADDGITCLKWWAKRNATQIAQIRGAK